jgi:galactokinase
MPVNTDIMLKQFADVFEGRQPTVIGRAPGRVNLIGEHTDYNDGYVLPIAMERAIYVAARPRNDGRLLVRSTLFDRMVVWSLDDLGAPSEPRWANYIKGTAAMLMRHGIELCGADVLIASELPVGGGVSSSAALEVGTAKALLALVDAFVDPVQLALWCRQAEHEYANSPCGIMDQFACLLAHQDSALLLDCRSQKYDHLPFNPAAATVVVMDTQVKHDIGAGEYPVRQQQCKAGVEFFRKIDPSVRALRDVSEEFLAAHLREMDKVTGARCRHVITENHRVIHAAEALRASAFHEFGQLMTESHRSLRDDYQVSCEELDALVEIACGIGGVYGARMTGGGFGGCAIALTEEDAVDPLRRAVREKYDRRFAKPAIVYTTHAAAGADVRHF